jgi:hypothetical protein
LSPGSARPACSGHDTLRFPAASRSAGLGLALAPVCLRPRSRTAPATPVASLKVAKDFKVELLYTVPKGEQGSWVSMCWTRRAASSFRISTGSSTASACPALGSTAAPAVEPIEVPIGMAQGMLYAFDSLYVMCADDKPYARGLYRVRDTNGDDKFDEVKLLRGLDGGGEHGPHAILLSPDGKSLTIVSGNQCKVPALDSSACRCSGRKTTCCRASGTATAS